MAGARDTALRGLIEYRRKGAWPDLWLKKELAGLDAKEAGLATYLLNGVLQRQMLLDFYIGHYSSVKLKRIMPQVLDILRLGAYQLCFMGDGMPAYAVVNEAVGQARKRANPQAAGFVNSLLRTISRNVDSLPEPDKEDRRAYMAMVHSHPRWFVDIMADRLGEAECEALLAVNNQPPSLEGWVNTGQITSRALAAGLEARGIPAAAHGELPGAVTLGSLAGVGQWPELKEGRLYIMGAASQLCVHALAPAPGARLVDMCAAPGGKTLLAAREMGGQGSILAMDIHPHKADLLAGNAETYGFGGMVETVAADAAVFRSGLEGRADYIICDVPCSGLGVIRRKPDIRYKSPESFADLPALQRAILDNAGRYLKPGGVLVYSTCTVLEAENEAVVAGFLADHPGFEAEGFTLPMVGPVPGGMIQLWPHIHGVQGVGDGFFMAKLRKKA